MRGRLRHPRLVTLMVGLSLAVGPGVMHGMAARGAPAVEIHKVDEAHFNPVPGGPIFLLVLGNDARPGETVSRADAIHLIGVNPGLGKASILDIPRATGTSDRPASVSATPWRLRANSGIPSSFSSRLIALDSAGWATKSRSAARVKCSSSATVRK